MKVKIPIAAPLPYTTGVYLERAFTILGHDAEILDQKQLYQSSLGDADLFCCVDSGGPLNIPYDIMPKASMWFIDSRRNCNLAFRNPTDDETALRLLENGGLVFQAQKRDVERLQSKVSEEYHDRVFWLPLAADPDVWCNEPVVENPEYILVSDSNCYDLERLGIFNILYERGLFYWPGTEGAVMEKGAALYRNAMAGLNVPSWFGTPECYDINMRVFEVLSCGRLLITNWLPELEELGILEREHYLSYLTATYKERDGDTVMPVVAAVSNHVEWMRRNPDIAAGMGHKARELIVDRHTYIRRALTILEHIEGKLL